MKVSVVTNAYNQGRFLRRCMESVLRSPGVALEYIVIDPGSTDGTAEILAEYERRGDPRLTILRAPDKGPADGLNKGFARACGEWFLYLNADDFLLPGGLARGISAIAAHPQADCVYGDGYLADARGRALRRVISTPFTARRFAQGRAVILQQSTFYKATSFRKVGGFNLANTANWDGELLVDMAQAGMELVHVAGLWSAFVIHPDSITGSQRLAETYARNFDRMFLSVTGRPRSALDRAHSRLLQTVDRLLQPRATLARIADIAGRPRSPDLARHLPPAESARTAGAATC